MFINRNDERYKDIESFQDYELTQCVVYEMYIRTPTNTDGINMEDLYDFLKDENILDDVKIDTPDKSFSNIDGNIKLHNINKKNGYNISTEITIDMSSEAQEQYDRMVELYDDLGPRMHIEHPDYKNYSTYDINDLKEEYSLKYGAVCNKVKSKTTILENFKRPKIDININEERTSNIKLEIDLNRPIEELIAYVKHIKEDMDNDKNTIKVPIELLGIKLQKSDNSDAKIVLSKQKKLAHMFYIYDCLKAGIKRSDIINEIFLYSLDTEDNPATIKRMDNKTLNTYYNIAIDYIDNQKYKELLTGIKLENLK